MNRLYEEQLIIINEQTEISSMYVIENIKKIKSQNELLKKLENDFNKLKIEYKDELLNERNNSIENILIIYNELNKVN